MAHTLDTIIDKGLDYLKAAFGEETINKAVENTQKFQVEVPSWQLWVGFGGGGRFEKGGTGGAARNAKETAEDAGFIHKLTKSTPTFGTHILWFLSEDGVNGDFEVARKVQKEYKANGVSMGSICPTYFLAGSEDGSFTSQNPRIRKRYIEQTVLGARIAAELSDGLLSLWFPDGTNYPGQRELQDKIRLMKDCMEEVWEQVPDKHKNKLNKVLVEYKVFEPGTYSTTIPDWGTAVLLSRIFGEKGAVLIDLGHHHHSKNIEQIIAHLIGLGIKGGFHFNTRYAADDDHSVQADYEMAKIFYELLKGDVIFNKRPSKNWAYAMDQMPRREQRIPSILKSLDALKKSLAKASLVDTPALNGYQKAQDWIRANVEFEKALLHADVEPIVMESYRRMGLHPIPLTAYYESDYQAKIERERV